MSAPALASAALAGAPPRQPEKKQRKSPNRRSEQISTAQSSIQRFLLALRLISYIMLTTKSVRFAVLWISRGKRQTPETSYLFPPSAYRPADYECCTLPCKLSRYHLGPHTCGARHSARGPRFSGLWKVSRTFITASGIGHFGHIGGSTIDGAIGMLGTIGLGYFAADKMKNSQQAQ
jgi:hypothetical protein